MINYVIYVEALLIARDYRIVFVLWRIVQSLAHIYALLLDLNVF